MARRHVATATAVPPLHALTMLAQGPYAFRVGNGLTVAILRLALCEAHYPTHSRPHIKQGYGGSRAEGGKSA